MDNQARIACVYKTGGDFTLEYVKRLAHDIEKHTGERLVCLSDDPRVAEYADHLPLRHGWQKWWSKLELFERFSHCVYFDLDTIIKGDVRFLLDIVEDDFFAMLLGFSGRGRGASGVMAWRGDYSYITRSFDPSMIESYSRPRIAWGDQDFINDHLGFTPLYLQQYLPVGYIASRKKSCGLERINCTILCYHGKPRPHDTRWAKI